jgi:RNA polymerase sigma factor (sigma-70 family)
MRDLDLSEQSDPELWAKMLRGNEDALAALHSRHYRVLYRYAFKICKDKELSQDCLQELFFQLWSRRNTLSEVTSVRFYLMKWLKRDLIKALKNVKTEVQLQDVGEESLGVTLSVEDMIEESDAEQHRRATIQQALSELSPREREVIYMRFFLELTYDEICKSLKLSYQVVMNYVHRALKAMRSNELFDNIFVWLLALSAATKHFLIELIS